MSNTLKTLAILLTLSISFTPVCKAQDASTGNNSSVTEKAAVKKSSTRPKPRTTVGRAVEDLEYLTEARPNPKAKNFIYLFSASWCGPCKLYMPKIVEEYPKMIKKNQVELILMSPDSPENIKKYVEHYKAEFPAIAFSSQNFKLKELPGMQSFDAIPFAIVINGRGETLFAGSASGIMNWQSIITKKPDKKGKKAPRSRG